MTALQHVLDRLDGVRPTGDGKHEAQCPCHDDRRASLSISTGDDGRVLVKCHADCETEAVVEAIGLRMADLFERTTPNGPSEIVAEYDYLDENGKLLFQVVRFEPKSFRQRRPDGKGGWIWKLKGVRRVLYRLPDLLAAPADSFIYVCEGEKDADRLRSLGMIATCNPMGAGKWSKVEDAPLHDHSVVVLPHNDTPGRRHSAEVAASLHGKAASVKILELPGLPDHGGDASDWLDAGGTAEQLCELADEADEWAPAPRAADASATASKRNLTELGNAERFFDLHGGDVRFCSKWRKWLAWDGRRWMPDDLCRIQALAVETVRAIYHEAGDGPAEADRKAIARHATHSEHRSQVAAMIELARHMVAITPDALDTDHDTINLATHTASTGGPR